MNERKRTWHRSGRLPLAIAGWKRFLRLRVSAASTVSCLTTVFVSSVLWAAPDVPLSRAPAVTEQHTSVVLDQQMANALEAMSSGDIATASQLVKVITTRYPDFALAQLLSGELQALAALDPLQTSSQYAWSPRLVDLLLEARRRLGHSAVPNAAEQRVPAAIIQAGRDVDEILLVDLSDSALYRYQSHNGALSLRHKHYVSIGREGAGKQLEGDLKTPIGLYRITESLVDAELPALYGHGALVLDYPNALDRQLGRTGYGIWLHGNPAGQVSRAPYSSEGCVTMTNEHMAILMNELPLARTPVILSESAKWHTPSEAIQARKAWLQRFAGWRSAWLNGDVETLERLYHPSIRPASLDRNAHDVPLERVANVAALPSAAHSNVPLLDEQTRKRLVALKAKEVSILASPQGYGELMTGTHVRMSLPADQTHPGGETILWWALDERQRWQIITEEGGRPAL